MLYKYFTVLWGRMIWLSERVIVSGRLRITTNLFYGHLLKPSKMLPVRVFYFNVVTKSAPYESPQSIRFMWAH